MLEIMTDLRSPFGSQLQWRSDRLEKDRRAAMYYGQIIRRSRNFWSDAEQFALSNNIFFGETIDDPDAGDRARLAEERPDLMRLLARPVVFPFPLIVVIGKMDRDLGHDPILKAVVARWLLDHGTDLYTDLGRRSDSQRYRIVTDRQARKWVDETNAPRLIAEELERLEVDAKDLADHRMSEIQAAHEGFSKRAETYATLGEGPERDVNQARVDAALRRSQRESHGDTAWTDGHIRQYLELYGYQNPSGTIGRWSHEQFQRLMQDPPGNASSTGGSRF